MSGGSNATISFPGSDWVMEWTYGFDNFQLDIVGFLAVLGEGAVLANAQVSALSRLFYLPRLMPAPQALLWPTRPSTLPSTPASVTAVQSGNVKDHIHHVANILLSAPMPTFTVRCVEVTKSQQRRSSTFSLGEFKRAETQSPDMRLVTARANGPLSWVTLLGCFLSISLFILSITFGDGWSLIATLLLSLLSTLIGVVNKWNLKLPQRPENKDVPPGDVVIRYPNGSFLVVKCDEDVARELYFAPEEIDYNLKSPAVHRLISLLGTLMLMLGVIALANARLQLQFAWALAYIISNAGHWIAAALPPQLHWDLSCYKITEQGVDGGPSNKTFMDALWKAIVLTKSIRWVKNGRAAPQTAVWDSWLYKAEEQAKRAGRRIDAIEKPVWVNDNPSKCTVWEVPRDWNARKAWKDLNDEETKSQEYDALNTLRAV